MTDGITVAPCLLLRPLGYAAQVALRASGQAATCKSGFVCAVVDRSVYSGGDFMDAFGVHARPRRIKPFDYAQGGTQAVTD